MKTQEQRKAEREAKEAERLRKAEELRVNTEILSRYDLRVTHLRHRKMLVGRLERRPIMTLGWYGEDVTVASVSYAGGRLFTIARVNVDAGDRFSKVEGRRVAFGRLLEEFQTLDMHRVDVRDKNMLRCWGWFYWSPEQGGRDTIMFLNMVAASAILSNQVMKKYGVPIAEKAGGPWKPA